MIQTVCSKGKISECDTDSNREKQPLWKISIQGGPKKWDSSNGQPENHTSDANLHLINKYRIVVALFAERSNMYTGTQVISDSFEILCAAIKP